MKEIRSSVAYGMAMWRHRPIRYLILCGLLLIAAIAVTTAIMVSNFRNRALDESERELKNTALILAEQLDRSFQAVELVQRSVIERSSGIASSEDYARQMSGWDVHLMLRDKIDGLVQVDAITLIDANGRLLNFSRDWPIPDRTVADRDYFAALKSDEKLTSYVSLPVRNRGSNTWTVFLAHKIKAPNGEFLGLVLGAIELSYFEKLFGSIVLAKGSSITLYRSDGIVLARHPSNEAVIGKAFPAAVRALKSNNSGSIRFIGTMGGSKDRMLAAHRLAHYPLLVSVATDTIAALAEWQIETRVLLGAGGLAAMTIAIMIFLIVRQLSEGHRLSSQRLALKKQQLDAALNNMMQGLCMFDADGRVVLFNQRYVEMMDLTAGDLLGVSLLDILERRKITGQFTGDPAQLFTSVLAGMRAGAPTASVTTGVDGRALRFVAQPMTSGGWVATIEDITVQRDAEQERDRDRKFLNQIINNVPATIIVRDAHTRKYVLINQAAEEYFGAPRDQIIGKTAHDVWPHASVDVIDRHDDQLMKSGGYLSIDEYALPSFGKSPRFVTSKKIVIRGDNGEPQYLLGVIEDVSERKRSAERIEYLAHYDALTDLPNRVLFREKLERALGQIQPDQCAAVLYLDLDNFKSVNDTLGHPVGDELLKVVAVRLRTCLKETDIVARLAGDEFAIVQTEVNDPIDVIELVTRVQSAIRQPCEAGGHQLVADISIGVALAPDDGIDPDQLLKNADLAMYGAKANGRGTYRFFEPDMDARVRARRALEFDLREAITDGRFELNYQPLLNLRDNKITGCEALLRWRHPKRGMISPTEFIPVAEESGLIITLGEWVLKTACAQAAMWPNDIVIAVNVSPVQFKSGSLIQVVISALAASGLPAQRLELEITEAVLIRDDEAALVLLHQLRGLGVRIALDDFGTGYSSLSYLQRFPFDKIKIDRCFIKDVAETEGARSIVQAVVSIATTRNITTTAEGVETQPQMELLRALGCTEMQGYLFSPAIPAVKMTELILSRCEGAASAA